MTARHRETERERERERASDEGAAEGRYHLCQSK